MNFDPVTLAEFEGAANAASCIAHARRPGDLFDLNDRALLRVAHSARVASGLELHLADRLAEAIHEIELLSKELADYRSGGFL